MAVLEEYLTQIKDLTIMPPVLLSVLTLQDDNELPFSELEKMVQSDQILVARMLRLANSPFYNRGNKVQNIRQILTRLGFKTVRSMVALAFMDSVFSSGNYSKFRKEVWEHSIAKSITSQFLCDELKLKKEYDSAMLGGLLQDLGKIVLNTIDRKKYIEVLTRYISTDEDILDIEREFFNVDNVVMGEAAAVQWKLPSDIVAVIAKHYADIPAQPIAAQIVTFAGMISRKSGYGKIEKHLEDRYQNYMDFFGIEEKRREKLPNEFAGKMKEHELYKFVLSL